MAIHGGEKNGGMALTYKSSNGPPKRQVLGKLSHNPRLPTSWNVYIQKPPTPISYIVDVAA